MNKGSARRLMGIAIGALILICSILPGHATGNLALIAKQEKPADIAGLSWMSGDWEARIGESHVEEHWTAPAGGTMVGMGRTTAGGKTKFFEYLRIEVRSDGVYYVASPMGRPGVDFRLARMTTNEVVFENPGHSDHLKQITYRRQSESAITARVEGADGGKSFTEDYPYRRMAAR